MKLCLFFFLLTSVLGTEIEEQVKYGNPHVTYLNVSHNKKLSNLDFLTSFHFIKDLNLSYTNIGDSYKILKNIKTLERLNLEGTVLTTLNPLKKLKSLKYLRIGEVNVKKLVRSLIFLSYLEELELETNCIEGIENISQLVNLKKLSLSGIFNDYEGVDSQNFPSLHFLCPLINLIELDLSGNEYIFKIKPLLRLLNLKVLNLRGCKNISDLKKIKKMTNLKELNISGINFLSSPNIQLEILEILENKNIKRLIVSKSIAPKKYFKRLILKD